MKIVFKLIAISFLLLILGLLIFYYWPEPKIPNNVSIDKLVVIKSERKLFAYHDNELIKTYKVALGKKPIGRKEFEGDGKTPEGTYIINDKNPNSAYHKNLGISYPTEIEKQFAYKYKRNAGGDVKIHGLNANRSFLSRFQRFVDWTNGCIAVTNDEIDELYTHIQIGTIIEIRP